MPCLLLNAMSQLRPLPPPPPPPPNFLIWGGGEGGVNKPNGVGVNKPGEGGKTGHSLAPSTFLTPPPPAKGAG